MKKLQTETMVLGIMATNCYLAMNTETKGLVIVDPAAQPERIIRKIEELGAVPEAVLLTHGHFDHIGAAAALRDRYGIPVCAFDKEQEICESPDNNLSLMFARGFAVSPDRLLHDGETVQLAGTEFQVIHTPGHTIGGTCYYVLEEDILFSGDTLFCESVGRSDFPTGSMRSLHDSIHTKLFVLPDETLVLPGHNSSTSIGHEKKYNPY